MESSLTNSFFIVRMPHLSSNIPNNIFYSAIFSEVNKIRDINLKLWSCEACNCFPYEDLNQDELENICDNGLQKEPYNISSSFKFDEKIPRLEIKIETQEGIENEEENVSSLNFEYYNLKEFSDLKSSINHKKSSSFLHTNIRSINKNIDSLSALISDLDFKFDFIGLSETWQNSTLSKYNVPESLAGYHSFEYTPGQSQNSGCGLYIKNSINYSKRDDLSSSYKLKVAGRVHLITSFFAMLYIFFQIDIHVYLIINSELF